LTAKTARGLNNNLLIWFTWFDYQEPHQRSIHHRLHIIKQESWRFHGIFNATKLKSI